MLITTEGDHAMVDAASQRRLAVDNGVFSEKNALPWSTGLDHVRWRPISTIRIGIDFIVGLKD